MFSEIYRPHKSKRVGLFFTEQDEVVYEEDFSNDEIFEENALADKDVKDKSFNFYNTFISWTVNSGFLEKIVEKVTTCASRPNVAKTKRNMRKNYITCAVTRVEDIMCGD